MKILMMDGPVNVNGKYTSSKLAVLDDHQTADWFEVRRLMMRCLEMRCYKQTGKKPAFHEYRCNAERREVKVAIGMCVHKCYLIPVPGLTELESKLTEMQIDLEKKYGKPEK